MFGLPSDFMISFDGTSATPVIDPNSTTLSATYNFSDDAVSTGFLCNCNNNLPTPPTILSNTDTWTATPNAGNIVYGVQRSSNNLTHECQIDCVNGQPTGVTGGAVNYSTNISACYIINISFAGDIETELAGVTLSGAENGQCDGGLGMSFSLNDALPAELGSFEGTAEENSVVLDWTSLSEENVFKYIVERSADGISNFKEIGSVAAFGNSQAVKDYSFEDRTPIAKGFYRLKTLDLDESFQYTRIIVVEKDIKDFTVVNVFPNPVDGPTEIIYETKAFADVHFKIFDVNGSLKTDQLIEAENGFNKIEFDFTDLQEGIYFILLESGTEKVVKRITKLADY